jgi:hypothetical protein
VGWNCLKACLSLDIAIELTLKYVDLSFEEYTCIKAVLLAFDFQLVWSWDAFELHRESTSKAIYIHTHMIKALVYCDGT